MKNIQPATFRYTIITDDTYTLPNAPDGWMDTQVKYARNETYWGMLRSLTVPQKFVKDGAYLLRKESYMNGLNASGSEIIEICNPSTYQYAPVYRGKLDFAKYEDNDNSVTINTTEDNINTKIAAFENVKYEIPLDNELEFTLTPIKLIESADFIIPATFGLQLEGYTGTELVNNEVKAVNASVKTVEYRDDAGVPNFATDSDWFFQAQADTVLKFSLKKLKGIVSRGLSSTVNFKISLIKNDGVHLVDFIDANPNPFTGFDLPAADYTFNISAGERIFFYQNYDGSAASNKGFIWEEGEFHLEYETISPITQCKGIQAGKLFDTLIQKVNGIDNGAYVPYATQSFKLNTTKWSSLVVTCGDAIRQIPGAKIKTSLSDFYKSMNAVLNVGMGMDGNSFALEDKSYFMRNIVSLDVGQNVRGFSQKPAIDLCYNTIKVGYADQIYDALNGRDEVNSTQYWRTDITSVQKELSLISEYRADAYGIEQLRISKKDIDTTDSGSDNDVFMVMLDPGLTQPVTTSLITGVGAADTFYNYDLSPKQMLLRHGDYLHSIFDRMDGYYIRFVSGLKNTEMVYNGVAENADISISALPPPIFKPNLFQFETGLVFDAIKLVESKQFGLVSFIYKGATYKGFIGFGDGITIDIAKNSKRTFTLLCGPNENLLQLIRK